MAVCFRQLRAQNWKSHKKSPRANIKTTSKSTKNIKKKRKNVLLMGKKTQFRTLLQHNLVMVQHTPLPCSSWWCRCCISSAITTQQSIFCFRSLGHTYRDHTEILVQNVDAQFQSHHRVVLWSAGFQHSGFKITRHKSDRLYDYQVFILYLFHVEFQHNAVMPGRRSTAVCRDPLQYSCEATALKIGYHQKSTHLQRRRSLAHVVKHWGCGLQPLPPPLPASFTRVRCPWFFD